jgi:endonuclease YncB( thermonuclease family)
MGVTVPSPFKAGFVYLPAVDARHISTAFMFTKNRIPAMDDRVKSFLIEHGNMVTASVALVLALVLVLIIYRKTRRISHIEDLPRNFVGMSLTGIATSVNDGDGFRFFHTPCFRSSEYTDADDKLYIRLAGIDAPEMRHFCVPEQPLAREAREYLRKLILRKRVKIRMMGMDRYNRVLAFVETRRWCFTTNVNLEMVRSGHACVYGGRDAVYGRYEGELRSLQRRALSKRIGMWKNTGLVLPLDHKKIHRRYHYDRLLREPCN